MKIATTLFASSLVLALVAGGCTAPSANQVVTRQATAEQFVALTILGPERSGQIPDGGFRLGAGDTLGHAVYENYASIVRANPKGQYASGE
jgi:hypothetical protein